MGAHTTIHIPTVNVLKGSRICYVGKNGTITWRKRKQLLRLITGSTDLIQVTNTYVEANKAVSGYAALLNRIAKE